MSTRAHLVLMALLLCGATIAQDPDLYFAQRAVALIDPSRSGEYPGPTAVLVSRAQWAQLPTPYRTHAVVLGIGTPDRRDRRGRWGFGARVMDDRAGDPKVHTFHGALRSAYHLQVSRLGGISFGTDLLYEQRTFGGEGRWGSQYDGMSFDPVRPSGELSGTVPASHLTFGAGISYRLMRATGRGSGTGEPALIAGVSSARLGGIRLNGPEQGASLPGTRYCVYAMVAIPVRAGLFDRVFVEAVGQRMDAHHTARLSFSVGQLPFRGERLSDPSRMVGYRLGMGYLYRDALCAHASLAWQAFELGLLHAWSLPAPEGIVNGRRTVEVFLSFRSMRR